MLDRHQALATRCCVIVITALTVLLSAAPPARAHGGGLESQQVESFVADYLRRSGLPGASVVVTQGGRVISADGYGQDSEGRDLDQDSLMPIASLSKSFTAMAILQLVDRDAVDLDQPVVRYLPGFATADPRSDAITVRQLLNQTSGLSDQGFREKSEPQPRNLDGVLPRLRTAELVAPPGTAYHYTNTNYHLAARLVEVVSGERFAAYLDRHVFTPLGMDRTSSVDTTADMTTTIRQRGNLMIGTHPVPMDEPLQFLAGSSGVITTAADLGRWLIAVNRDGRLADGGRLLSPQEMIEWQTPSAPNPDYALGWELGQTEGGRPQKGHGGIECTFTANQTLVPGADPASTSLGVAVMSTTGYGRSDSTTLAAGVVALAEGRSTDGALTVPPAAIVDWVILALIVIILAWGLRQLSRARAWAAARSDRARWRLGLRSGLAAIPVLLLLSMPSVIRFLTNGRDLTWVYAFFFSPTVMIFLGVWALAAVAVSLTRLVWTGVDATARP